MWSPSSSRLSHLRKLRILSELGESIRTGEPQAHRVFGTGWWHWLNAGAGRVICVDSVLPPVGDAGGTAAKFLDLLMMVNIRGKERTRRQWEELYAAAGFHVTSVTPLQDNFGTSIVEGVKT